MGVDFFFYMLAIKPEKTTPQKNPKTLIKFDSFFAHCQFPVLYNHKGIPLDFIQKMKQNQMSYSKINIYAISVERHVVM